MPAASKNSSTASGSGTAADAGKAKAAAEPCPDLAEDQAVGQRVEGSEGDGLRPRRRAFHRPADRAVRPDLRLAALERPPRARVRQRAGDQPAHEPPARGLLAVDPEKDALVELDPQLRHGRHHHRAHRRQVAAQVQDVAVVHAASLAQVHELHLPLEGVPRLQQREHRLALDVQQVGELAQVELIVGVGERHALGGAGRARGVDDRRQVVGRHLGAPLLDLSGRLRPGGLAELHELVQRVHGAPALAGDGDLAGSRRAAGVVRRVDDDRRPQARQGLADLRQLRRVFQDDHRRSGMAKDGLEDVRRRVRRARHVDGAEEVDGETAHQPLRAVVADERDELAAAQADLPRERQREHTRATVELRVGEGREDAVDAPAERRLGRVLGDPAGEQPRQRRHLPGSGPVPMLLSCALFRRVPTPPAGSSAIVPEPRPRVNSIPSSSRFPRRRPAPAVPYGVSPRTPGTVRYTARRQSQTAGGTPHAIHAHPYLSFKDNAREAMEFYASVFGGKLDVSTFKEYHASEDPSEDDKVMHARLEAANGIVIMGADTPNRMEYSPGARISMSLSGDDEAELRGYWDKLQRGRHRGDAPREGPLGRHLRDAERQVRHRLAGEHLAREVRRGDPRPT